MDKNSGYFDWLSQELERRQTYHDHKERMAWTATIIYVPSIVGLSYTVGQQLSTVCLKAVYLLFPLVLLWVAYTFINMQFEMRWKAHEHANDLRRALHELLETDVDSLDRELPESDSARPTTFQWPAFARSSTESKRETLWAANVKLLKYTFCCTSKIDARWRTELPSYYVLVLSTLFAMITVFVAGP